MVCRMTEEQTSEWIDTNPDERCSVWKQKSTGFRNVIHKTLLDQIRREAENKLISELYERNLICNGYNEGERYLEQRRAKLHGGK